MLYKSAKEGALLLVFLHPRTKIEEEDKQKYQVPVGGGFLCSASSFGSGLTPGFQVEDVVFALVCSSDNCCARFNQNRA